MPSPVHSRPLKRAVAVALAVGYAMIGSIGEGLHDWSHAAECGPASHSTGCVSAHVDGVCLAPSTFSNGGLSQSPSDVSIGRVVSGHGPDCVVCQILAQLKQATSGKPAAREALWVAFPASTPVNQDAVVSPVAAIHVRGPPAWA